MFRYSAPGDYAAGMSRFILCKENESLVEENKKLKEEIESLETKCRENIDSYESVKKHNDRLQFIRQELREEITCANNKIKSLENINLQLNAQLFKEVETKLPEPEWCRCNGLVCPDEFGITNLHLKSAHDTAKKETEKHKPKFKVGDTVRYAGRFVPWVLCHGEIVQVHTLIFCSEKLIGVLGRNYMVYVRESELELINNG